MRHTDPTGRIMTRLKPLAFALLMAVPCLPAAGYETEDEQTFDLGGNVTVSIISTTDTDVFAPIVHAFQAVHPDVDVRYVTASTNNLYAAIKEGAGFDLAISSAMDLQMKLANDGYALPVSGPPDWPALARWRDEVWGFAQEPVVTGIADGAFGSDPPRTRSELIDVLRQEPDRFDGRVGTYDPVRSGAGFLFATQDARQSETSWRLAEVMGGLHPKLYASTGVMLSDLASGKLLMAYNVLGAYAAADGTQALEMLDYTHILIRTALVPTSAPEPAQGRVFLNFLLSPAGQMAVAAAGLPPINEAALARAPHLRPIPLDTGLLVYVDKLVRGRFLREWTEAVRQP